MLDGETVYSIEVALGALFVLFDGWSRFNQLVEPEVLATFKKMGLSTVLVKNLAKDSRSSTTALGFFGALGIYLLILLAAYSLLLLNRHWLDQLAGSEAGGDLPAGLSPPLLAALVLVVVVPRIKLLSPIEEKVRGGLQRLASIPLEVIHLAREIRDYDYRLPAGGEEGTDDEGKGADDEGKENAIGDARPGRFRQAQALIEAVEGWEERRGLMVYLAEHHEVFEQLKADAERAARSDELYRESGEELGWDHPVVEGHRKHLEDQAEVLLRTLCYFIAGGLLRCCRSHAARRQELRKLGFDPPDEEGSPIRINQVVLMLIFTWVVLTAAFAWSAGLADRPAKMLLRAGMFSSMGVASVLSAVLVWTRTRRRERSRLLERPYHLYLLAGAIAFGACLLLGLLFRLGDFLDDPARTLAAYRAVMPYHLVSVALAFGSAFLLDDRAGGRWAGRRLRLLEGGGLAAFVGAFSLLAFGWLERNLALVGLGEDLPPALVFVGLTVLMSFLAGAFIPWWCREAARDGIRGGA